MSPVFSAPEMHHTIDAGEGCASTLVAVRIKLLLGKDVAARLVKAKDDDRQS